MKHEPVDVARAQQQKPVADMSEAEFAAWMAAIRPVPGIPVTEDEAQAAVARARAAATAGRCHSHALVGEWIATISAADFVPFEEWIARRNA